jgi:hypothetical protein
MFIRVISAGVLALALAAGPALSALIDELSPQELRQSVASGKSLSLQKILETVTRAVPGEAVDVRAFDVGGVYFHVLVMQPNGKLASIVVDAATGKIASNSSALAKVVRNAAKATSGSTSAKSGKGKGQGKGGSGGNAGGNGNGNGGGNGGGNGNGNGGGNGNGNGGGNGRN